MTKAPMRKNANAESQLDKFKDAAKELETDDRESAFDKALKKVAKAPPPTRKGTKA